MAAQDSRGDASKLFGTVLHKIQGPLKKDSTYRYYVVDRGYTMVPPENEVTIGMDVRFHPPGKYPQSQQGTIPSIDEMVRASDAAHYERMPKYTDFWDVITHLGEYLTDLAHRRKEKNGGILRRRKSRKD